MLHLYDTATREVRELALREPGGERVVRLLVGAAALAVVAADASRMSKAEVERIWLPFVPWLLGACALVMMPHAWHLPAWVTLAASAVSSSCERQCSSMTSVCVTEKSSAVRRLSCSISIRGRCSDRRASHWVEDRCASKSASRRVGSPL